MNNNDNNGIFRNFEFPQFFATIPQTHATTALFNRRIREFSNGDFGPIPSITDADRFRVRIKIQERGYISREEKVHSLIEKIKENRSLHACRLMTLVRFLMLRNLNELPVNIIDQEYLLAWMGGHIFYEVSVSQKTITQASFRDKILPSTMIIMESDPI